jgi:hypothetical protein
VGKWPAFYRTIQCDEAASQEHERTKPERVCTRLQRRTVEYEVSVTVCEKSRDVLVASAGLHLLAYFASQIDRKLGPRIRERLVLADETANVLHERSEPAVELLRVPEILT